MGISPTEPEPHAPGFDFTKVLIVNL